MSSLEAGLLMLLLLLPPPSAAHSQQPIPASSIGRRRSPSCRGARLVLCARNESTPSLRICAGGSCDARAGLPASGAGPRCDRAASRGPRIPGAFCPSYMSIPSSFVGRAKRIMDLSSQAVLPHMTMPWSKFELVGLDNGRPWCRAGRAIPGEPRPHQSGGERKQPK